VVKKQKRTFKKIIGFIHLWLGLASGILVVFLGITGCILVFEKEIESVTQPVHVTPQQKAFALPSQLKSAAEKSLGDNRKLNGIEFPGKDRSAIAYYYNAEEYYTVLLNPYTAEVLKVKDMSWDFFRIVINGHYYLWLPPAIGQPIVASATLIFFVMLISGIILWWPKNKAARKQRFTIKWDAKWRRKNYDLHNVFGFYASWIAIFFAITGLVMGFQWFAKSVYWVSSGGKALIEHQDPLSDSTKSTNAILAPADAIFLRMYPQVQQGEGAFIGFANSNIAPVEFAVNHRPGTYYKQDAYHFDQYTLKELPAQGSFAGKYAEVSVADKLARMNYDIHVGAIGGLPTKILAFCGSLIAASLPITGFMIWRGRKKKSLKMKVPLSAS
jgi:uncharacterized iron-regulated membrane protein